MREIFMLGILIAGLWGSDNAMAAAASVQEQTNCSELAQQVKEYKLARHELMKGLIKKNDTMADTLDIFAVRLEDKTSRRVDTGDVMSLKKSAEAFRSHAGREGRLIDKFEQSSDRLFKRVADCLKISPSPVATR